MLRAVVRGGATTGPTHTFNELQLGGSTRITTDPSMVEELLRNWMSQRHSELPGNVAFNPSTFQAAEREHRNWLRRNCDRECAEDSASAAAFSSQVGFWDAFEQWQEANPRSDPALFFPGFTWSAYLGSRPRMSEVEAAVMTPDGDVSASPEDLVSYSALKRGGPALWRLLARIFGIVIDTGEVPKAWTCGFIRWLWKGKGSKLDPSMFRGITLTSCIGKTFERVLYSRLLRWSRCVGAVPLVQSVSQAHGGVLEQIGLLSDIIASRTARRNDTWLATVDLKGAFPSTSRPFLWCRLRELGLRGSILRVLVNLFTNVVCLGGLPGGGFSCRVERATGVPEGFVLSPFLFAIAISGLVKALEATGVGVHVAGIFAASFFFVGDIALVACSYEQLQTLIWTTVEWCRDNRFVVHPDKTEVLIIGPGARAQADTYGGRFKFQLMRGGGLPNFEIDVEIGKPARYLGAMFRSDLKWDDAIVKWRKKSGVYIGGIARAMAVLGDISRTYLLRGFTAHARSVEEWACPVWGSISCDVWKRVETRDRREACRLLGNSSFGVASVGIAILLGQLPVGLRIASRAAAYALRLDALIRDNALSAAVADELREGSMNAFDLSSMSRSVRSCESLGLMWPSSLAFTKAQWKSKVRAAAQVRLWHLAEKHPSLALLVMVRPSKGWLTTWILDRPARGDCFSNVLIVILGGRWRLFADVRHDMNGARGDGDTIEICDCDLCDVSADDAHAGDAATVLLQCPRLEDARRRWFTASSRTCEDLGQEILSWWRSCVESAEPSVAALAAAIFGHGVPLPRGAVLERLVYDLTMNFVLVFGPLYADNEAFVRGLGVPRQVEEDVWVPDGDGDGDDDNDDYDSDDDGDGYFNDRLEEPLLWL